MSTTTTTQKRYPAPTPRATAARDGAGLLVRLGSAGTPPRIFIIASNPKEEREARNLANVIEAVLDAIEAAA